MQYMHLIVIYSDMQYIYVLVIGIAGLPFPLDYICAGVDTHCSYCFVRTPYFTENTEKYCSPTLLSFLLNFMF